MSNPPSVSAAWIGLAGADDDWRGRTVRLNPNSTMRTNVAPERLVDVWQKVPAWIDDLSQEAKVLGGRVGRSGYAR